MIELQVFFFIIAFVALIIALVAIKYALNLITDNEKELDELSNRINMLETKDRERSKRENPINQYHYILSQEEVDRLTQLISEIKEILHGHQTSTQICKIPSLQVEDVIIKISGCPIILAEDELKLLNDFKLEVR